MHRSASTTLFLQLSKSAIRAEAEAAVKPELFTNKDEFIGFRQKYNVW